MLSFTTVMKRNLFSHIPIIFIVLIFCTFSFIRLNASTKNSNLSFYSELMQKHIKSVHTPDSKFNLPLESLFENETEDETESEFNAALPILSLCQDSPLFFFALKSVEHSFADQHSKSTQSLLYLIVCSIRV
jgi:hypothetical protein